MDAAHKKKEPSSKRKQKKNNWIVEDEEEIPNKAIVEPLDQEFKQYKSISELSLKYSFNIQAVLGSGFASTVYLGTRNETKEMVCIKAVDLLTLGFNTPYIQMIHN
jgi:hypothetical protein